MVKIDCLKEKRALIAMYFCGKEKRTVSPEQVFGSWTTWWKDDYIAKNHLIYKISDGQLIHNSQDNNKDDELLKEYNEKFQKSYQWISKSDYFYRAILHKFPYMIKIFENLIG